ncbi:hypothetical protein SAMN05444141_106326 [Pseudovibrio denitrificans]|uniref:Uncharacterized protein n=1 Tax=Pseudovibrio denitrificans TaxID=258256 RepID=A0A1I7CR76_9HYPH|nr:hypothetical protein SAMN05444141_106326 [Pseudovibrio denitrificans]
MFKGFESYDDKDRNNGEVKKIIQQNFALIFGAPKDAREFSLINFTRLLPSSDCEKLVLFIFAVQADLGVEGYLLWCEAQEDLIVSPLMQGCAGV